MHVSEASPSHVFSRHGLLAGKGRFPVSSHVECGTSFEQIAAAFPLSCKPSLDVPRPDGEA